MIVITFKNIYLFILRERERERVRERNTRGGRAESVRIPSRLHTVGSSWGLIPPPKL